MRVENEMKRRNYLVKGSFKPKCRSLETIISDLFSQLIDSFDIILKLVATV